MTVASCWAGRLVARCVAVAVMVLGVVVLLGWMLKASWLIHPANDWVSVKPSAGACFIGLGVALWQLTAKWPRRFVVILLGVGVGAAALTTLVGYAVGADLHIDRLLAPSLGGGPASTGMAAVSAVALLLLSAGVLSAAVDWGGGVQAAGLCAFAIGYTAVLGYLLDVRALDSVGGFKRMALPTSVGVALAAVGLLTVRPAEGLVGLLGRQDAAGRLTRRVVPFLLVGAAGLGALDVAAQRAGAYPARFGTALLALSIACVGVAVTWRAGVVVGRSEDEREARAAELRELTEKLHRQVATLVATAPDAIVDVDESGVIVAANPQAARMFGYRLDELVGQPVEMLVPDRLRAVHDSHRQSYGQSPQLRLMGRGADLVGARADGSEFPITVSLAPMPGDPNSRVLATVRDLSQVRAAEATAAEAAHRFVAAFDDAPVGMLLVDLDDRMRQVNQALADMLSTDADALVGRPLRSLLDPRDVDADRADRAQLLAGHVQSYRRELRLLDVDREPVWTMTSTSLVRDAAGAPAYLVLHVEDIRSRRQYERRLQYLADHDPLTGLFNRRRFDIELTQHLAEQARYGGAGAVLLMDLDHFKYVNDTLGHHTGDRLIRAVAHALHDRVRESDVLARLGGDEFAVLLPSADLVEAQTVADALLEAVRTGTALDTAAGRPRSTASIGIALLGSGQDSAESVLAAADLAMYAAKEEGRDRAAVYDPAGPYLAKARAKLRWLDRIRAALEHDLLTLQAQPIVEIATGKVTQLELLLRLREGDALVPPDRFLYIAERHGLGPAIDRWVVQRAVAFAATLTDPEAPRVEVNLSADSLADPDLPGLISDLLVEHQVPASRMVFEVTETAAIANIDTARAFVEQVSELGCGFALDDFGAGFGSFYYLKYLPFDYLKIDGEFVRQLTASRTDQLIVTSIVAAARGLDKRTIAEYVGDAETLALLAELGVDYAQGYHLGRPMGLSPAVPPPRHVEPPAPTPRT